MRRRKELFKYGKSLLLIICLLTSAALTNFTIPVSSQEATRLYINPPELNVLVHQNFTVSLCIENVENLYLWEVWISFNPNIMNCTGTAEGPFLPNFGPTLYVYTIDNENGTLYLGGTLLASAEPASGDGILAYINFTCTGYGVSLLHLYDTYLADETGSPISHETTDGVIRQGYINLHSETSIVPTHMHSEQGLIDPYMPPIGTIWHELYPEYCNIYNLTSWEDNGDDCLSPCDQIDMTNVESGEVKWYHVDRLTITLIVTEYELVRAIEFIGPYSPEIIDMVLHDPVCTYWHEVMPEYSNIYHIIGWEDNGDGELGYCDYITVNNTETSEILEWHVEDVATDIILTEKILSPYCTYWHELYPIYCLDYHVVGWDDNGDKLLSPCDKIELQDPETMESQWYHVEDLTLTLNLSGMFLEFTGGYSSLYEPIIYPVCTYWHEVYPQYSNEYHIVDWIDNGDCILSVCDTIGINNTETGNITYYHVDEISYDLLVLPTSPPWYMKGSYSDYAPSGMPDFDQNQVGTYVWRAHCGPVAVANSLWWFDSKYEPNNIPPPAISDGFPLVQSYNPGVWDDHDPRNVQPLVEHLAWLMDCNGMRTGRNISGTYVWDMEAGITQYLSWSGVNPLGDVNGDGVVDQTDVDIVIAAMGSSPGDPNWNLAADIFPATVTYPPVTDNFVDEHDLDLVTANLGKKGMFYEHTTDLYPDFFYIEEEVEKSQDVILLLSFYYFNGTHWVWVGGHYVTVAGVNSTTQELLISDPDGDTFEAGQTPGRSPVPHAYPHGPTVHNDASLVSHDAYKVSFNNVGGYWILEGYINNPLYETRISYAVITSPFPGVHDIAVTNVTSGKTIVGQTYTCNINITVTNEGNFTETFNVTLYANTTEVETKEITLTSGNSTTITFTWNTTGFVKGNYTLWAYAWPVLGETDIADNSFTNGVIMVTTPGDLDGDYDVDILDVIKITAIYALKIGDPRFNPNSDLDNDGVITILDVIMCTTHYGEKDP